MSDNIKSSSNSISNSNSINKAMFHCYISIKIWILFQEKYSINVHSDVLDIPDVFWKCLTTSQYTL